MTSTSCITGTGFMKCMPITCSGRLVRAAISVIEIELVFVARIVPAGQALIQLLEDLELERGVLGGGFHRQLGVARIFDRGGNRDPAGGLIRRLLGQRALLYQTTEAGVDAARPRSSAAAETSTITTWCPLVANTWAMPFPMVPAPTTVTFMSTPSRSSARSRRSPG